MRSTNKYLCASVSLCLIMLYTACSEDKVVYDIGEYKLDLATVQFDNDKQAFLLDNNVLLLNGRDSKNVEAGQRVLLNYSYLEEISPGYDHVIKVNGIAVITLGKLEGVNPVTIDTMTNKPIHLESAWIGSRYLNISFYMNFHSTKHSISLITDKSKVDEEEIFIYFRHNDYGDPPGSMHKIIASFDLSNVLEEPDGDRQLIVNINSSNYGEKDYLLKY